MASFEIRPATPADIPALLSLVNSAYRGDTSRKGWTTEADLLQGHFRTDEASLQQMMEKPGAVILVYSEPGQPLHGCVYLEKKKSGHLYLGMLSVSPEIQARGIGKKLLAAADEHARRLGCTAIQMTVISVRAELIAWYERNGYRDTGVRRPFPNDPRFGIPTRPLEFMVMEKPVGVC